MVGSRARLFIENFFVYGVGNVLTRVVPFLMLPFLTRLITDPAVFGVFDIYIIIIRFATPLAIFGCCDAMFRLFFDDADPLFPKQICSSSLAIVTTTSLSALAISMALWASGFSFGRGYRWLIPIAGVVIASQAVQSILAAPTRMQNQRRRIILISLSAPLIYYLIAMILACKGMPLEGLVYGNLLSGLVVLAIYSLLNHSFFSLSAVRGEQIRELLKIGIPLTPAFFIYWIFTSCDRFMIGHMIGLEAVGLYGVGARLSSISQGIYMAFAGGWQYFAFSTMKDEDHTQLMSRVFEVLGVISVASLFLLLPFVSKIFRIMVAEQYREASVVFPYLYISPLLLMLYQIVGNQFLVIKRAYLSTVILTFGGVSNILLNWLFIPRFGIEGAALATAIGYSLSVIIAFVVVRKMGLIYGSWRQFLVWVLSIILFVSIKLVSGIIASILSLVFVLILCCIYRSSIWQKIKIMR